MNEDIYILKFLVVIGLAAITILYVYIPFRVWRIFFQQVDPEVIPFDPATTDMPPDVRAIFAEQHRRLLEAGFRYLQTVSLPRFQANMHQVNAC